MCSVNFGSLIKRWYFSNNADEITETVEWLPQTTCHNSSKYLSASGCSAQNSAHSLQSVEPVHRNNAYTRWAKIDKLQGSVATYFVRCGEVFNTRLRKAYHWVCQWQIFHNPWTFGKVTSKSVVVSCTLHAWSTHCWKTMKVHETITFLLVTLPNIHWF